MRVHSPAGQASRCQRPCLTLRRPVECRSSTPDGSNHRTVIEHKAADVLVLGSSATASAVAYSLARQGKKVIHLPNFRHLGSSYKKEALRPLHLASDDSGVAATVAEAAAYWRGLQSQAEVSFLQTCGSLDLGLLRGQSDAASTLGRIQDASQAAGVKLTSLRSDELATRFPQMRATNACGALLQGEGGVLNSVAVEAALNHLARRQGVVVRDQLLLRGWLDKDGHFAVRASSRLLPDTESVFEAEQVILAPEVDDWTHHWQHLFGLRSSLQVKQAAVARCPAASSLANVPLWRFLGSAYAPEQELQADPILGCWGFPMQQQASRLKVAQAPGKGYTIASTGPTSEQLASIRGTMLHLQHTCSTVLRGMEDVTLAEPAVATHLYTADGLPLLGFHPGFEEGRMLVAACTSGGSFGGCDGYQLAPLLAKGASDLLQGTPSSVPNIDRWSTSREAVEMTAGLFRHDPWEEMDAVASSAIEAEDPELAAAAAEASSKEVEEPSGQKYWMP